MGLWKRKIQAYLHITNILTLQLILYIKQLAIHRHEKSESSPWRPMASNVCQRRTFRRLWTRLKNTAQVSGTLSVNYSLNSNYWPGRRGSNFVTTWNAFITVRYSKTSVQGNEFICREIFWTSIRQKCTVSYDVKKLHLGLYWIILNTILYNRYDHKNIKFWVFSTADIFLKQQRVNGNGISLADHLFCTQILCTSGHSVWV